MLALLGLAVFSTALALVIYFILLHSLGSVGVTSQAYLRVPIGVAIGVVFLGEQLTVVAVLGPRVRRGRCGRHDYTRSCASLSCGVDKLRLRPQWDIKVGTVMLPRMVRVAPPRMNSRSRECP